MHTLKGGFGMNNSKNSMTASELARAAVAILIEKKAQNVKLYDVGEKNPLTDFYVNATGRSHTHVASLGDDVVDKLSEMGVDALRVEGRRGDSWILVDYGDVILNIFDRESREFYNLDRLMPSEALTDISDIIDEVDKKLEISNIEE